TLGFTQPAQSTGDAVPDQKHRTTQQPPRAAKAAGYGVYWADAHPDNVASPVDGSADTFRGCLQAAVHAIRTAQRRGHAKLTIYTDDQELHRCVAKRMKGWKERQWKRGDGLPIPHADLLQQLDELRQQVDVKFDVPKNSKLGARGQTLADRLAFEGAERYPISG
ncbi:Ribonuclease H1, partial [Aphelenchoides avenae]